MIVSFDFDSTLTMPVYDKKERLWTVSREPYQEVIGRLCRHHANGDLVYVVTSRFPEDPVEPFIARHGLPIEKVVYTEGNFKGPKLKELGVELHYDDSVLEVEQAEENKVNTCLVIHPMDLEMGQEAPLVWVTKYAQAMRQKVYSAIEEVL